MKRRLYVLDAMRGIAALAVFNFHCFQYFGHHQIPQAYLAVDFFFMLSGFIMQYTYGERLAAGWPALAFLRARFIRLYPIYFLAMVLGAAPYLWLSPQLPFVHVTPQLQKMLLAGLAFIPSGSQFAFPLDHPAWSLLCEGLANVVHAIFLRRLRTRALVIVACCSGAAFAWHALWIDTADFGRSLPDLPAGLARALFSYIFGMLLYRWWARRPRFTGVHPALPIALLAILCAPVWGHPMAAVAGIVIFFPIILVLGAMASAGSRFATLSEWLGSISYPVYLLHLPAIEALITLLLFFGIRMRGVTTPAISLLMIATVLAIASVAAAFYDPPARAALNRFLPGRKHLPH